MAQYVVLQPTWPRDRSQWSSTRGSSFECRAIYVSHASAGGLVHLFIWSVCHMIGKISVVVLNTRRTMTLSHIKIMIGVTGAVIVSVALSACGTTPATTVEPKREPAVEMSSKVQALQRQIQERDKRIEELESQLDALKVIDQDHEKQRKPLRAPTTIEPIQ